MSQGGVDPNMGKLKGIYTTIGWWFQIWFIFSLEGIVATKIRWLNVAQPPAGLLLFWPRSHQRLHDLGFAIAAYPLTLLSAGLKAQEAALQSLKQTGQVEAGAPAILG